MRMITRQISVGDNLQLLGELGRESAQLVYMDPPFASGREYKAVLQTRREAGHELSNAFSDMWHHAPDDSLPLPPELRELLDVLQKVLPRGVMNYLRMMAPRLFESWRVLDERGSLYVHCDPSASHYLKALLDVVFGPENFRNEIIWRRTHAHSSARRFGPVHDVLLYYTKSDRYVWNQQHAAYSAEYRAKYYTKSDSRGPYQLITCTGPGDRTGTRAHYEWRGVLPPAGRHWAWKRERMEELDDAGLLVYSARGVPRLKRYIDEKPGVALQDVWADIPRLDAHSIERVGYETQKPIALLSRIIEASTEPGALVVDPFAGSGTTAVAAERLGRSWAIADTAILAGSLALSRLRKEVGSKAISLSGFPASVREASALRDASPAAFGAWGTGMLGASIDRKRSNKLVTKGAGLFGGEGIATATRSWVPLDRASQKPDVTPEDVPVGVRVGFVLDHPRAVASLQRVFVQTRPSFRAVGVSLSDAVSLSSRQHGLATKVERNL